MTHKKLLELFTRYEKFITEKFLNIDAARMRIDLPVHENPTDLYRHLLWMCGQGKLFVYWRKGEPDPFIDVNFAEGIRTIRESRILATLLKAAAATAEGWVAKPPWPT